MESNSFHSLNTAGLNLLTKIIKSSENGENVFVSPLSIALAFGMLTEGLEEEDQRRLSEFFGFDTNQGLSQKLVTSVQKIFAEKEGAEFNLANSLWSNKNRRMGIKDSFQANLKQKFNAIVDEVDPSNGHKVINSWIEDNTNKKIKDCVSELDNLFLLVLVNAVYFKGSWENPFDSYLTQPRDFYLSPNNSKKIDFMNQKTDVCYLRGSAATYISLKYKGTSLQFVVGLPDSHGNFDQVQMSEVYNVMKQAEREVKVKIPKFKLEFKTQLGNLLKAEGLDFLFTPGSHFKKITDYPGVSVNQVIHQTFLQVDEVGTEAAGVTAMDCRITCVNPTLPLEFIADRPFKFFIMDKETELVIFSGVLNNPSFDI